jgi:signal transduction histidine kinase
MRNKTISYIIAIVVSTLVITYLHHSVFREQSPHIVLEELYYIPLLFGALTFGLKGALLTYLFVSAFYLPYLFGNWAMTFLDLLDRFLHLLFSAIFVSLAGFLIDRERKNQRLSEIDRYLAGLGQAAATIVHDLKNPLITILGFARRIQAGKTNMDTAIQTIIGSAENMQRIVNGALDFAKPMELELREEDILNIVRQACGSCRTKAEERGVTLSMDAPGHSIIVPIDGLHMQRAVINLIDNAIEASQEGQSVIITVGNDKNYVMVQLRDKGSGMDKETLESIFIPFYSKKNAGTGLGMSIAKKIVEGHHGKIQVTSRPGHGTEVMIELPYQENKV